MRLGLTLFITERTIDPVTLACEAEARGFHSLYLPEHTHIPASRRTPAPMGGELPEEYGYTFDPFVSLAAAAGVTSRIRLGTGICLVAQRDPIVTAKVVATLDRISGGRFVFGVGLGWNREEMEHHGTDFRHRRDVVRERLLAMQALWTRDEASFEGRWVRFEPSWAWPKPVQSPRPPVLFGGAGGPRLFELIAACGDGWVPVGGAGIRAALPALRAAFEQAGRSPDEVQVVPFGTAPERGKLDYYASLGIREAVLPLPPRPRDDVLPILDAYAKFL